MSNRKRRSRKRTGLSRFTSWIPFQVTAEEKEEEKEVSERAEFYSLTKDEQINDYAKKLEIQYGRAVETSIVRGEGQKDITTIEYTEDDEKINISLWKIDDDSYQLVIWKSEEGNTLKQVDSEVDDPIPIIQQYLPVYLGD